MTIRRSPSAMRLLNAGKRGLLPGDTPEPRADGHTEPGQVALADNVARHDLACGEHVGARTMALHQPLYLSSFIHFHSEIRKRDSRPKGIAEERRPVDRLRPVGLRWIEAFSAAVIENLVVERTGAYRQVEFTHG